MYSPYEGYTRRKPEPGYSMRWEQPESKPRRDGRRASSADPSLHRSSPMPAAPSCSKKSPSTRPSNPPRSRTYIKTTRDMDMAAKQTRYQQLDPKERAEQDKWAQSQIRAIAPCIASYRWSRTDAFGGGYRCDGPGRDGGRHLVTDGLLAEGRGGCYTRAESNTLILEATLPEEPKWIGPHYGRDIERALYDRGGRKRSGGCVMQ